MASIVSNDLKIKPLNLNDLKELKKVEALYNASFPDFERKPFSMIINGMKHHTMKGYSVFLNDQHDYVGLAFLVVGEEADILDYLAIDPTYQNHHIGSSILSWLSKHEKPFFVEIESTLTPKKDLLPGGSSKEEAIRRKNFYLANGMVDCFQEIYLFKARMELLASQPNYGFKQYWQVMSNYLGAENLQWAQENVRLISPESSFAQRFGS